MGYALFVHVDSTVELPEARRAAMHSSSLFLPKSFVHVHFGLGLHAPVKSVRASSLWLTFSPLHGKRCGRHSGVCQRRPCPRLARVTMAERSWIAIGCALPAFE